MENAEIENNGPAGGKAEGNNKNENMKPAKKLTSKKKYIKNTFGNPVLIHSFGKTMSKIPSSRNRTLKQKKNARKAHSATIRKPAKVEVTPVIILERIERYRKEVNDIYEQENISSLERAKNLLNNLERMYYRMNAVKLGTVVEAEIDANALAETIQNISLKILEELEKRVNSQKNANESDAAFTAMFGALGF
jgi:hypothetical protein